MRWTDGSRQHLRGVLIESSPRARSRGRCVQALCSVGLRGPVSPQGQGQGTPSDPHSPPDRGLTSRGQFIRDWPAHWEPGCPARPFCQHLPLLSGPSHTGLCSTFETDQARPGRLFSG